MWQALHEELAPRGLEVVTVALDTDPEAARPWIEAARPQHPSLIDRGHILDALFGIVNVPSGVWIDERGTIVRPPETAYPRRPEFLDRKVSADATPRERTHVAALHRLRVDSESYVAALRDWVEYGAASRYALSPEEVLRRSRPRPVAVATAAAHFALGQHLHDAGQGEAAIPHFREAQRLHPDNWTYKRQAWALLGPDRSSVDVYGADWLSEAERIGVENYYPPVDL